MRARELDSRALVGGGGRGGGDGGDGGGRGGRGVGGANAGAVAHRACHGRLLETSSVVVGSARLVDGGAGGGGSGSGERRRGW